MDLKKAKAEEAIEGEKVAAFINHWAAAHMCGHIPFCLSLYLSQASKYSQPSRQFRFSQGFRAQKIL